MDDWGWEHLTLWSARRLEVPPGPLFCIIDGPTAGRGLRQTGVRAQLRSPSGPTPAGGLRRTSYAMRECLASINWVLHRAPDANGWLASWTTTAAS